MARIEGNNPVTPQRALNRAVDPAARAAVAKVAADVLSLRSVMSDEALPAKAEGFFARAKEGVLGFFGKAVGAVKQGLSSAWEAVSSGFMKFVFGPLKDQLETREVLDDPDTTYASPQAQKRATMELKTREPEEAAALAKLGDRAKQYERLKTLVGDDVMARHALQGMLLDGRLTGGKDLRGGKDLLTHLSRMAEGPLAEGVDRAALVASVIEEAENPTKIAQQAKGTCVATSSTILLARENPTEYARLVADLASPAGKTRLQNGAELQREADWSKEDGGRTPSVALLQPALMEYGNFFLDYDNDADTSRGPFGWGIHGGLSHWGADRILEGLTGRGFGNVFVTRFNKESTWKRIEAALADGKSVPASLFWSNGGAGGHQILIDKVEGDWVYYTNPWGQQERAQLGEFKQHLSAAQIPGDKDRLW